MRIIYKTPCGELDIEVNGGLVWRCRWINDGVGDRGEALKGSPEDSAPSDTKILAYAAKDAMVMQQLTSQLDEYFAGKRRYFDLPLLIEGTPFREKVWQALTEIPYGEVVTYSELADRCGCPGGQRAVAQACSANRLPILIPCHRVVRSDGSLGGYTLTSTIKKKGTTPQGLDIKRFLLQHESRITIQMV